jgi:hypothetical protein
MSDPEIEELRDKVHCAVVLERTPPPWRHRHVWTYMDPARLQRVWQRLVPRSQLLTYIRLPDAA